MGLRAASPVLVGRERELARLVEALDAAIEGGAATAFVGGEAGVGKTRLVQEFGMLAERRGCRVCTGRCLEFGEAVWPLAPLGEIMATLVEELDDDALDLVLGGARDVLSGLIPALGGSRRDAAVSSEQLCELLIGVFARLAERRPLVLVVEDLHWADDTSRMLVAALAGARRVRPLLLVGTFRSDELHRPHPLRPMLAEVERTRCERIELTALGPVATAELICAIQGSAPDRAYADAVHHRTAGNPFFVEELVAARTSGVGTMPDTLRDVILARAAVLDDIAVELLGIAAVAGPVVPEVLGDVSGLETDTLQRKLGELVATALLVRDGDEVRFRHELGREVFYDELLPGRRAQVHTGLAESLQGYRPDRVGDIARHWTAARNARRALAASMAAGRQALPTGAAAEAENHLTRVLELWPVVDDPEVLAGVDHPGALMETAVAAEHAGHLEHAVELARQAAEELASVDPRRAGEAWLLLGNLSRFMSRNDEAAAAAERALAEIPYYPPSKARAEALAAAAMCAGDAGRPIEAINQAREAVAVAEAVGESDVLVVAHSALAASLHEAGDHEQALAVALGNLERCDSDVASEHALMAYNGVIGELVDLGRNGEIPSYAERAVTLARCTGLGGPRSSWMAQLWVDSLVALGRWVEAERVVNEQADLLDHATQPPARLAATWGVVLVRQGRIEEARPLFELAGARLFDRRWSRGRAYLAAAIVEFAAAEGRCDDVEAVVSEVLGQSVLVVTDEYLVTRGIGALADCIDATMPAIAKQVRERAVTTAMRWIERSDRRQAHESQTLPWRTLERDQVTAEFERLQGLSDPERWARVAAGCAEPGFRYDEALARYRRAKALIAGAAGHANAARTAAEIELAASRSIAEDLGAAPLLADIDRLARLERGRRQRPSHGWESLTPTELQVAELVAEGQTNPQIAQRLLMGRATVKSHLEHMFTKLGVSSRAELAALVVRQTER